MALGPRLDLRQSQSLVMTPQLQQAIKLLALSNLEIETWIGEALDSNPLLDLANPEPAPSASETDLPGEARRTTLESSPVDQLLSEGRGAEDRPVEALENPGEVDRETGEGERDNTDSGDWGRDMRGPANDDGPFSEDHEQPVETLAEHLLAQVGAAAPDHRIAAIARYIVGLLDEAGYLTTSRDDIAFALDAAPVDVAQALELVQSLDPTGVGATGLAECIALQAREADRYDPAMAVLIDNLDLVARGDLARLKRICHVDDEDLRDMLGELRGYDPKPGLQYGGEPVSLAVPDVILSEGADGGWVITINQETLPRLIVNRSYYTELKSSCSDRESRGWLSERLTDANWLIKALDQRQKTILKVASEIVRHQDGFFRHGVSHLKPLTLKTVAEAIDMHESTVSRVTSNKYLQCSRGTFELKYFFTSGVSSADGEGAASAEAVKAAIRQLIDAEDPKAILSDDTLVELLHEKGFSLARRTVAKYREAIGLGSSVQRRRQKALAGV
ncbi:MAG: RNA polymerase factor sigma-54 [Novosphingobium sp.]|nr:RNA polymerase factor sigma-54 [Novosphingobium sp.]